MRFSPIVIAAALTLAACGGDDDKALDPAESTTTTAASDEAGDLFDELEAEEVAASGGADGDDDFVESSDDGAIESASSDPDDTLVTTTPTTVVAGPDTAAPPSASAPDVAATTPARDTAGGADGENDPAPVPDPGGGTVDAGADALCTGVQAVADAFDLVDDADADGTVEDLRTAYLTVIDALGDVRAVAPTEVVGDIDRITVGIELVISSDVDGDELTDDQNEILSSEELLDAGDRFEDFAVNMCGTELFAA